MVLYFSGTGNTRFVAEAVAKLTDDKLVNMGELIRTKRHQRFYSEQPFVFCAPIYAWRFPRIVESFIEKSDLWGSNKAYFIATCESQTGNAAAYLKKICDRKNIEYMGFASVAMPENYTIMFDPPDENEIRSIINKSVEETAGIINNIIAGKPVSDNRDMGFIKGFTAVMNPVFYSVCVNTKRFEADSRCISCGKCAAACPFGTIAITGGKPVWNGKCTHCMACINGCPANAIEFGNRTMGRDRYFNTRSPKFLSL